MCSRPFRPLGFAHLCRSRPRGSVRSSLPSQLYVDHSHCPRACASYPSCVAVYPRDSRSRRVLCRSTHSLHCITAAPAALDRYLAALPAMSLIPFAPLKLARSAPSLAATLAALPLSRKTHFLDSSDRNECCSAVRPVRWASSELVVLVLEQDLERSERSGGRLRVS